MKQCKTRWKNALSPDISRDPFTPIEDHEIIHHQERGLGWPEIALLLPGRTAEQIRDRFINCIDPDLKTTPWTPQEDELLTEAQQSLGNKWTEISKLIPGRSENSIKNRWHNRKTKQRRLMKRLATVKHRRPTLSILSPTTRPASRPRKALKRSPIHPVVLKEPPRPEIVSSMPSLDEEGNKDFVEV